MKEKYNVQITRREFMFLPVETRMRIIKSGNMINQYLPSDEGMKKIGPVTENPYSQNWIDDNARDKFRVASARRVLRVVLDHKCSTVLDYGCGSGVLVNYLSRRGIYAIGVDRERRCIDYCIRNQKGHFYLTNTLTEFPQVDMITATHVLEHIENYMELLVSFKTRLRKGGILYVSVPNLSFATQDYTTNTQATDHLYIWSSAALQKAIESAGFNILKVDYNIRLGELFKTVTRMCLPSCVAVGLFNSILERFYSNYLNGVIVPLKKDSHLAGEIAIVAKN